MKILNACIAILVFFAVIVQFIGFYYNEERVTKYLVKHNYIDSLVLAPDSIISHNYLITDAKDSIANELASINKAYALAKNSFDIRSKKYMSFYKSMSLLTNLFYVLAAILVIIKGVLMGRSHKIKIFEGKYENINNLVTVLLRIFDIETECRVSIFVNDTKDESKIKIFHRFFIQRTKPPINKKLRFSDNEGLPGKAKANPFIVGKPPTIEEVISKVFINHIPGYLFKEGDVHSTIKQYYKEVFDISEEKFNELSDLKYSIKSYLSVGIMCEEMKNVIVLSIDSMKENAFYDLEIFNTMIARLGITEYLITRRRASLIKAYKQLLPVDSELKESLEETSHEIIDFKTDPYLIYGMIKYILELIHKSTFNNKPYDND